ALFVERVATHIHDYPVMHVKQGDLEMLTLVQEIQDKVQQQNQMKKQEQAETTAARREVWKCAEAWDTTYLALKSLTQGVLILLGRSDEYGHYFLDVQQRRRAAKGTANSEDAQSNTAESNDTTMDPQE
ncbi:MAG: hypothetical protein AAGJ35_14825, partial [Myxococcota bacterium]